MVGIHGINVLITHKARVRSHVELMAIDIILEDVDKAEEVFLVLAMATAAVAMSMAMVVVLVSMLFRLKLQLHLKRQ
jgi:hypothetical protein